MAVARAANLMPGDGHSGEVAPGAGAGAVAPAAVAKGGVGKAALVLALALQWGCTSVQPPPPTATRPSVTPREDVSYDWHGLVQAPFGTAFAALSAGLHEVLLFHDAAPGSAPAANTAPDSLGGDDCYRSNAPGPRFVGQVTTDYLWCFLHDHLERIEAVVRLPAADAPAAFARHCARWLEHTDAAERTATHCAGRDGTLAFSARLLEPDPDSATELAIVVYEAGEH